MAAPSSIRFDHDPDNAELSVVLGPDFAASNWRWAECDGYLAFEPAPIPMRGVAIFVLLFATSLSAAPFVLPMWGVDLPSHLTDGLAIGMLVLLWVAIVPTFLGMLWWVDRRIRAHGPGVVVDVGARQLRLPHAEQTVAWSNIRGIVDLRGRRNYGGRVSTIVQYGVLFDDADGAVVYASFAKNTARQLGGQTPAERLAEVCGARVRRVKATRRM